MRKGKMGKSEQKIMEKGKEKEAKGMKKIRKLENWEEGTERLKM